MKKMKMFFVAATLMLITAGVFAGKSKFFVNYSIIGLNGGAYTPLTASFALSGADGFQPGPVSLLPDAAQATYNGTTYTLYAVEGSPAVYYPVIF